MAVPQNTLPIHRAFGREGDAVRMRRKGLDARQVVPRNGRCPFPTFGFPVVRMGFDLGNQETDGHIFIGNS